MLQLRPWPRTPPGRGFLALRGVWLLANPPCCAGKPWCAETTTAAGLGFRGAGAGHRQGPHRQPGGSLVKPLRRQHRHQHRPLRHPQVRRGPGGSRVAPHCLSSPQFNRPLRMLSCPMLNTPPPSPRAHARKHKHACTRGVRAQTASR
jgi:hypothetical protein